MFELPDGTLQGHDSLSGTMNLIAYPCRSGKLMNLAVFDRPREHKTDPDDWNSPSSIEDTLEPIENLNELQSFGKMCRQVESVLDVRP